MTAMYHRAIAGLVPTGSPQPQAPLLLCCQGYWLLPGSLALPGLLVHQGHWWLQGTAS